MVFNKFIIRVAKAGFTLVELAIVLVIIGLLVGGILAGQTLIRQAEMVAVLSEQQNFQRAITTFRVKYDAFPGDMKNAFSFFGSDCGTDSMDAGTGCNGDGNGLIQGGVNDKSENLRAWEHMSRAGLIAGQYDATGLIDTAIGSGPDYPIMLSRDNSPKSKLKGGYWAVGDTNCNICNYYGKLTLTIGGIGEASGLYSSRLYPASDISNEEALGLDTKVDDGRSLTGKVRGGRTSGAHCNDGTGGTPTDYYDLAYAGPKSKGNCNPTFILTP